MGCVCKGIETAVAGLLLVVNDQGLAWSPMSAWLLVGIILIVAGVKKAIWPCCPVHKCGDKTVKAKKGK
jgi:hypothetical protein